MKKNTEHTLLSCLDVSTFAKMNKHPQDIYSEILAEMVNGFCNQQIPTKLAIHEMTEVIEFLSSEDQIRVIEKLAQDASKFVMDKEPSSNGFNQYSHLHL